jgi:hypothetical protein
MATILDFRHVASKREMSVPATHARAAEVILFPGVRYERWDEIEGRTRETQAREAAGAGRKCARDILELAD